MLLTSSQSVLEKLELKDEKNLLIQGLPSSVEKQFSKVFFAKNVTPLLKVKKIDFALVFAVNHKQLSDILNDVVPVLQKGGKLWVAYPKVTSKIVSDLSRDNNWNCTAHHNLEVIHQVTLDSVWTAVRLQKPEVVDRKSPNIVASNPASRVEYKKRSGRSGARVAVGV